MFKELDMTKNKWIYGVLDLSEDPEESELFNTTEEAVDEAVFRWTNLRLSERKERIKYNFTILAKKLRFNPEHYEEFCRDWDKEPDPQNQNTLRFYFDTYAEVVDESITLWEPDELIRGHSKFELFWEIRPQVKLDDLFVKIDPSEEYLYNLEELEINCPIETSELLALIDHNTKIDPIKRKYITNLPTKTDFLTAEITWDDIKESDYDWEMEQLIGSGSLRSLSWYRKKQGLGTIPGAVLLLLKDKLSEKVKDYYEQL